MDSQQNGFSCGSTEFPGLDKMFDRMILAITAHLVYLCLGIVFLFGVSLISLKGPITPTTLISGAIFIPLITAILLSVTGLPAAILSSAIYIFGGSLPSLSEASYCIWV
jgi:hypothetical protein